MIIITTTAMLIVQTVIVTWIAVTASEPCPKKYMNMGGDVTQYCEITSSGLGSQWSLKE
tara:strand:- start:619 stop:795 length:177 start_codon:yes stop_codon:yes gene_type:complete